jgi:hypothetical protein
MADGTNGLAALEPPRSTAVAHVVTDPIPTLDTGRFEQMQRLARLMSYSTLVPDHLRKGKPEEALANCFLVVNQAVRWGMDPFAVAQSTSVISGKLVYEGKLVNAVLAQKLGVRLRYKWTGPVGTDKRAIEISGDIDGETLTVAGTVADWKTARTGSPWTPGQFDKMLAYRGAREWARLHAPEVMLGVYAPDEFDEDRRPPRDITPRRQIAPKPEAVELFADQDGYITNLEELMLGMDASELEEVWTDHLANSAPRLDAAHALKAFRLYEAAQKRLATATKE